MPTAPALSPPYLPFVRPADVLTDAERRLRARARRADRRASDRRQRDADRAADWLEAEAVCRLVRGVMIATLDRAYCRGELGELLWRDSDSDELRERGVDVMQAVVAALFPEEFEPPAGTAARLAAERARKAGPEPAWYDLEADSLVPPGGPKRVGLERLRVFAEAVAARGR